MNKPIVDSDITLNYDTDGIKTVLSIKHLYDYEVSRHKIDYSIEKLLYFKNSKDSLPVYGKMDYTPTKGDKFYIYPECTVPRYKFKNLCEKEGMTITRDSNKANICVISDETLEKLTRRRSSDFVRIGVFMDYVHKIKEIEPEFLTFMQQKLYLKELTEDDYVMLDWKLSQSIEPLLPLGFDSDGDPKTLDSCTYYQIRDDDNEKDVLEILNSTKLYHENSILKYINSAHGTVMTEDMYNTIKNLFESSDTQNHVVAMESMANCVYPDSACYLILLLEEYGGTIYDNRTKNNINFRSMLKFFGLGTASRLRSVEDMLDCLKHAGLFNSENLAFFYPKIMEELKNSGDNSYFTVDTIKLTDEGMRILNTCEPNGSTNN